MFANNMLTNIKLSKAQFPKIIQSGGNLGRTLGNLGKKALLELAVPFAKDVLFKLVTKAALSALDKLEGKIRVGCCKSRQRIQSVYFK